MVGLTRNREMLRLRLSPSALRAPPPYDGGGRVEGSVDPASLPCDSSLSCFLPSQAHGVVARPLFFAGKRLRRTGHRPEVDPLSLARHFKRHPLAARRAGRARGKRAPPARGVGRDGQSAGRSRRAALDVRSVALRGVTRRMVRTRDRRHPAGPPARRHPGRPLRPADDATEAAPAAAHAGPRQPALPAALPGHGRQGADAPSRPLRRRPGAAGQRALARTGRPYRGAVRHRLCAGDAPRAGQEPARGVPLHPGAPSQALRRPLA